MIGSHDPAAKLKKSFRQPGAGPLQLVLITQPPEKKSNDQRAKAIGSIWAAAIALLALSIPLAAILRSALIPVTVIFGVAFVTLYLWNSGEKPGADATENEALRDKIKELEERLANVEVINRFEDRLAEKQLRQVEQMRAGASETPEVRKRDGV